MQSLRLPKCPSRCTLWADLGDLPVPSPHAQIPITALTVQLLGLGHSSVPLTTLCQEPCPVHCQVPWNQGVSIPIAWKEEGKYLFCTGHPFKYLLLLLLLLSRFSCVQLCATP